MDRSGQQAGGEAGRRDRTGPVRSGPSLLRPSARSTIRCQTAPVRQDRRSGILIDPELFPRLGIVSRFASSEQRVPSRDSVNGTYRQSAFDPRVLMLPARFSPIAQDHSESFSVVLQGSRSVFH